MLYLFYRVSEVRLRPAAWRRLVMKAIIIGDMSKRSAIVLMPFPIACIGLLLVTACAASGDDPPPTPTVTLVVITQPPHPDIAAAMTAIAEDNLKPRFTGVLNGFTFIGLGTPVPRSIDCTNAE